MRYIYTILTILVLSVLGVYGQTTDSSYKNFYDKIFTIGDKILAPDIYFGVHLAVLEVSYDSVKVIADFLNTHPNIKIELGAHTDSRGSEAFNQKLSEQRSNKVSDVLIEQYNIHPDRMVSKGYGEQQLLDDCSQYPDCPVGVENDCPCHQKNRRIEIKIVKN